MTTAILIDPFAKEVKSVEIDVGDFEAIYALLRCTQVDAEEFGSDGDLFVVDDEGLLINSDEQEYFSFATEIHGRMILAGRTLVVGSTKSGDWILPASTLSDVLTRILWTDHATGAAYARQFS
ncbi:MAG: hypothetical protein FD134_576 [Gallionellaceae bacterium]|nr:MAG: hypothetical protein FD134_576 [Gallionellaceae bacterium]